MYVESTGARRRERGGAAIISVDKRGKRREEYVVVRRRELDGFAEKEGVTGADSEGHVPGAGNRQTAVNALEIENWGKLRRN